jgi:hypothetical protein
MIGSRVTKVKIKTTKSIPVVKILSFSLKIILKFTDKLLSVNIIHDVRFLNITMQFRHKTNNKLNFNI